MARGVLFDWHWEEYFEMMYGLSSGEQPHLIIVSYYHPTKKQILIPFLLTLSIIQRITIGIIQSRFLRKGLNNSGTKSHPLRRKLTPRFLVRARRETVLLLINL